MHMTRSQRKGYKGQIKITKNDMQNTLRKGAFSNEQTTSIKDICDHEFKHVRREDRPSFKVPINQKIGKNHRDAIWFARKSPNGRMPCYRIYHNAYKRETTAMNITGLDKAISPRVMPEWLTDILDFVSKQYAIPELNHVVLHRYIDGKDVIGAHQDKDLDIAEQSTIVSISLGQSRYFKIRNSESNESVKIQVDDGDMILLPYTMNQWCKHEILKEEAAHGVRYSITARSISTFFDPDNRKQIYVD